MAHKINKTMLDNEIEYRAAAILSRRKPYQQPYSSQQESTSLIGIVGIDYKATNDQRAYAVLSDLSLLNERD